MNITSRRISRLPLLLGLTCFFAGAVIRAADSLPPLVEARAPQNLGRTLGQLRSSQRSA